MKIKSEREKAKLFEKMIDDDDGYGCGDGDGDGDGDVYSHWII